MLSTLAKDKVAQTYNMVRDLWLWGFGDNEIPRRLRVSVANGEVGFKAFDLVPGHRRRRKKAQKY